jgi:hypothetical protein
MLELTPRLTLGTVFVDPRNDIKITIYRTNISASVDERDVFGTQQQDAIEQMMIPNHAAALAKASSF